MKKSIILALLLLFQLGCSSTLLLSPQPYEGQEQIYKEGIQTILSAKNSLVAVRPAFNQYQSNQRPRFVVSVLNGTDTPYDFSVENVRVTVDGFEHKVFTYEELVAEIKSNQMWAAIGAALNSMSRSMQAQQAGTTYHTGAVNSTVNNSYGQNLGTINSSYSGYSYNYAAVQQAQAANNAQTQTEMANIRNNAEMALNNLSSTILKRNTVLPQQTQGGYIVIDELDNLKVPHEILIKIILNDEEHIFRFNHRMLQ
ncbi:hypothetical protein [Aliikangiella coralliicola]|uniref:Lipoprotein n=1 Tax=Aliikangiella coralliicola TaxID=2592383 RepID=A0A545UFM8_9GAMM|nr:hypothetical protein [Aliikangiella coralliicola]TQV88282.1 hypothetical protein FLL46_07070 [Aliikangiella coralliicola]